MSSEQQWIGRVVKVVEDINRVEPFNANDKFRVFPVSILYPLQIPAELHRKQEFNLLSLYHPASNHAKEAFLAAGVTEKTLATYTIPVVENETSGPIELDKPLPVVILSPGFGIDRDLYMEAITAIVEAGFIVITVAAPYDGLCTVFPDGKVVLQADHFPSDEEQIQMRVQDIQLVIDQLHAWNQDTADAWHGMFDLDRIGVIGHSLGGAAMYNVATMNNCVRCAILYDASLYLLGENVPEIPLLNMRQEASSFAEYLETILEEEEEDGVSSEQIAASYIEKQNHLYDCLPSTKSFVKIVGAGHLSFSTVGYLIGELTPSVSKTIQETTIRFLKQYLNDEHANYTEFLSGVNLPSNLVVIDGNGLPVEA